MQTQTIDIQSEKQNKIDYFIILGFEYKYLKEYLENEMLESENPLEYIDNSIRFKTVYESIYQKLMIPTIEIKDKQLLFSKKIEILESLMNNGISDLLKTQYALDIYRIKKQYFPEEKQADKKLQDIIHKRLQALNEYLANNFANSKDKEGLYDLLIESVDLYILGESIKYSGSKNDTLKLTNKQINFHNLYINAKEKYLEYLNRKSKPIKTNKNIDNVNIHINIYTLITEIESHKNFIHYHKKEAENKTHEVKKMVIDGKVALSILNRNIDDLKQYVELLKLKLNHYENYIKNNPDLTKEFIQAKWEVYNLTNDIFSKENYIEHYKKRKNVNP